MHEAAWYEKGSGARVRCTLCPHHCTLPPGRRGICLTRENHDGVLVSRNYGAPVSWALDPIEKKPLYHFHPGTAIFSMGANGCNLQCRFCQNHEIARRVLPVASRCADELLALYLQSGAPGIAFTYTEPVVWYETVLEIGMRVKQRGGYTVMVTNGFVEPQPLAKLLEVIDAWNVDIKSIRPAFYRRLCKGDCAPVLRSCEQIQRTAHLEITTLLIPGENDHPHEVDTLAAWIATTLGRETPLHLSGYVPRYRMTLPPTPSATIRRACEQARGHLDYVYPGNCAAATTSDTCCPGCAATLIRREGYQVRICEDLLSSPPRCAQCGKDIPVTLP